MLAINVGKGEEFTINVQEAFAQLTDVEKEEVNMLLLPMAYFKCYRSLFDSKCQDLMGGLIQLMSEQSMM